MDITLHLATTLKTLRQARGWSLSKLADETGVSKAMLGKSSAMNPADGVDAVENSHRAERAVFRVHHARGGPAGGV